MVNIRLYYLIFQTRQTILIKFFYLFLLYFYTISGKYVSNQSVWCLPHSDFSTWKMLFRAWQFRCFVLVLLSCLSVKYLDKISGNNYNGVNVNFKKRKLCIKFSPLYVKSILLPISFQMLIPKRIFLM